MKLRSVKTKVTLGYTLFIMVVFALVIGATVLYSEYYGEDKIKTELLDEVKDLREDIIRYSKYFPEEDIISYYDDGVMLSIYNEKKEKVNGILPDEFPENLAFNNGEIQNVHSEEESWFVTEEKVTLGDGAVFWIRGVHSYSSILIMLDRMLLMMFIAFPILIMITALLGYRMIRRSLLPVHTIAQTASEITSTSALSRRIPLPQTKDEFYELSSTFNQMFERLEENFLRERQFSSDAAHELRTPVAVILSHCEYCLEEMELEEKVADELRMIRQKAQQMSEMVNTLLNISREERRMETPEFEEVDLEMLGESVVEELREKAEEKQIQLELHCELANSVIQGDMSMLTRMFINLIENAISYGKNYGFVKILMQEKEEQIQIQFQDNGVGISKADAKKIWSRFYQADTSHSQEKGFGLGLYLVQQIVSCHRGTIIVKSELGKGSTFTVTIPRQQN